MSGGKKPYDILEDDLRYTFFYLLLEGLPAPMSDRQIQQVLDVTVKLVAAAVERIEQGQYENNYTQRS